MSDGQLLYKKDKDEAVKNSVQLTSKSKALVLKELMSEGGIYIEGPTHDPLFLKAESTKDAKEWIKIINDLIKKLSVQEAKNRNNTLDVFAKGKKDVASPRALGSRAGAKEKKTHIPADGGWVMRIGEGKTAKDVFVDAANWMYYANKNEYDKGGKVMGKADLPGLV